MTAVDDGAAAIARQPRFGEFEPAAAPRTAAVIPRTTVTPRASATLERRQLWERRYRRRLLITDTVIVLVVCILTTVGQLTILAPMVIATDPAVLARVPLITAVGWLVTLAIFNTRAPDISGAGTTEYKRVAHATGLAFGILAICFIVFQLRGIRLQLMIALPIGLLALLVGRWGWRRWLIRKRQFGHYLRRTLVVGRRDEVEYVIHNLKGQGQLGYLVVGTALDHDEVTSLSVDSMSYNVLGSSNMAAQAAAMVGADAIVVASRPDDDPDFIKRLSWQLEGTAAELILSSRLADVAGPRISLRPVDGLPLIHVKIPTFEGGVHVLKRALDIFVALVALVPIALITPVLSVLITLDSKGPVFFRQERVGRDGRMFRMVKFRSMKTSAESDLAGLVTQNEGSGPLFKLKNDPRVTRVGRVLRRLSLDELPQFWNVLLGHMSVVGPRPPLPSEVIAYDGTVFRRLYIKPGITGLWQISGRSDLSWDESVRLDLRYVENWSVMSDLEIMWRTVRVMFTTKGAY